MRKGDVIKFVGYDSKAPVLSSMYAFGIKWLFVRDELNFSIVPVQTVNLNDIPFVDWKEKRKWIIWLWYKPSSHAFIVDIYIITGTANTAKASWNISISRNGVAHIDVQGSYMLVVWTT